MTAGDPSGGDAYLALDTSGAVGSVALGRRRELLGGALLTRRADHASGLIPAIDRLLRDAGVERSDLAGVVVGAGPGSFTGIRVAAATAKGLAHALSIPVWAVSSLAAAATAVGGSGLRYVLFDARADRVYGACLDVDDHRVRTIVPPHAGTLHDVLSGEVPAGAVFLGDGAERHRALIEGAGHEVLSDPSPRLAEGLLLCLHRMTELRPVEDVGSWEPLYLRASSASPSWTP